MEVGKACDFEEQRKRLEKSFWEPGTSYADEVVSRLCLESCLILSILPEHSRRINKYADMLHTKHVPRKALQSPAAIEQRF